MPEKADLFYFEHRGGGLRGSSPPIVLVHGAGGSHLHWPPQVRRLPKQTVYAIDLPGHGGSKGPGCSRIAEYVDRIQAWVEAMGLPEIIMGGHSMGGAISLQFALQHADKLRGVILVGTGGRLRVTPQILSATADPARFEEAVDLIISYSFSEAAPERFVELARRRMLEIDHRVIHDDFIACDNFDVMDRLSTISLPALVLCGEADQLTPLKYSQYLSDQIEGARLDTLPGAGHMVMLEQPEQVASSISAFAAMLA